ncbi:HEAT repeat domain-containing protein [Bacillus sp. ISL-40]|nr:HEAT repeat domain-containing protein [Bacillus sp. ISL-40]MBT2721905.1 HEAT repeat domain-containing protein [Bacillus sp. ISL-46]MBT2727589.1 HEAT repeat domain-containing protein [Bacillus sp. ISL-75]MBT2743318.1 HEAT repeat domain-containing protein [Bacillus sp. ISL-77]
MKRRRLDYLKKTEEKNTLPENYEELKKQASRTSNWRERLDAVEELGKWKNKHIVDILMRVMNNDSVYKIQEAAFRQLKKLGEDVQLPQRKKGDLIKDITKILVRIKKSLPEDHSYEEFKEKIQKMRLDVYDTYEGDKGADFDTWLESTWVSLPKR